MKTSCGNRIWASFLTLAEGFCHLGESGDVESRCQVLHGGLVPLSVLPGHQEQFGLHVHIFAVRLDLPQFGRLHLQMSGQRLPPSAQLGCHVVHLLVGHHLVLHAGTWAKDGRDDENTPGTLEHITELKEQMAGRTVVAVFEEIVPVIVIVLLSCLDLFTGNVLLQVANQTWDQYLALWCPVCVVFFPKPVSVQAHRQLFG